MTLIDMTTEIKSLIRMCSSYITSFLTWELWTRYMSNGIASDTSNADLTYIGKCGIIKVICQTETPWRHLSESAVSQATEDLKTALVSWNHSASKILP